MGLFNQINQNFEREEKLLLEQRNKDNIFLSSETKSRIKSHIFSRIQSRQMKLEGDFVPSGIARFTSFLRASANTVFPDATVRARMRERIFARIASIQFFPSFNIFSFRKSLSFAVILIFVTATFVFFQPQTTFAQRLTTLEVVKGDVSVLRGLNLLPARDDMVLWEGDILATKNDSEAVIHYFDNSFSRLFSDTRIQLRTLQDYEINSSMVVEVDLDTGKMWSRVFDLVSDSQFTIQAKELIASVYHRATFIVSTHEKKSSVQVISNAVNVKTSQNMSKSKPVTSGFQAVVARNGISSRSPAVAPLRFQEEEKKWVETNLQKDEQLIAKTEQTEIQTQDSSKKIDNSSFLLSFDSVERAKVSLLVAHQKFEQAQNAEEKNAAFDAFIQNLEALRTQSASLAKTNSKKASELDGLINEALNLSKKIASPEIKEKLYAAEVFMSSDDRARSVVLIEQAAGILSEAQDFIDQGSNELALERFAQFEEKIDAASDALKSDESHSGSADFDASYSDQSAPLLEKIANSRKLYAVLKSRIAPPESVSISSDSSHSVSSGEPVFSPESASFVESVSPDSPEISPLKDPEVEQKPVVTPPDVLLPKLQLPRR